MKTPTTLALVLFGIATACGGNPPPAESPPIANAPSEPAAAAAPSPGEAVPDVEKTRAHAKEHVSYPATRAQVLEACASTTEFSEAEKTWLTTHLPEGTYQSADELLAALGL